MVTHPLTAATTTGVPPRVPSEEMEGISSVRNTSFDSAALTKPTGAPMIAAVVSVPDHRAEGDECRRRIADHNDSTGQYSL